MLASISLLKTKKLFS